MQKNRDAIDFLMVQLLMANTVDKPEDCQVSARHLPFFHMVNHPETLNLTPPHIFRAFHAKNS